MSERKCHFKQSAAVVLDDWQPIGWLSEHASLGGLGGRAHWARIPGALSLRGIELYLTLSNSFVALPTFEVMSASVSKRGARAHVGKQRKVSICFRLH